MKIIPMMVVLICASGSRPWKASALELRIPLLGRMKLEFQTDTTLETPVDGSVTDRSSEKVSEGEPNEDDGKQASAATEKNESTESSTKATTLVKDDKQTTQKIDKGPSKTTLAKEKPAEASTKATSTTATATDKAEPKEASTEVTEAKEATLGKDDKHTTQEIDKEPSKTTPAQGKPTEPPAEASSTAAETTTVAKSKPTNKPTEATTAKPKQTTVKAKVTEEPKKAQTAGSDPDDFDDSDIWDDTEEPPKEFGREYDLKPDLFDSGGNDLGDFQPKLQLPPNMTNDMFFESPAKEQSSDKEDDDTEGSGFFERIKRFFSIENIKEELDTIPGKMQTLMDRFRQKKSDGLKKLREQMDGSAEKVGQKIAEAFSKLKAAKKSPQQCAPEIRESFKQYEAALQDGIKPCMDKVQSVTSKQEGALRNEQAKFTQMLTDMQGCVSKLDSSGLNSFVKSILNMGSCTKKSIQSKIEASLEPQMKRLSEMVQQQGSKLNGNMNATGRCVERQLQLPQFHKMQQELVAKGKQCLEKND